MTITPYLLKSRSGSFVDNMRLPVHRWFRFSAGFSAQWVESLLAEHAPLDDKVVLDPFVGSGTTLLASDVMSVRSIGIEAHPFLVKITQAKLWWWTSSEEFLDRAFNVLNTAKRLLETRQEQDAYPDLIMRTISSENLRKLDALKKAWTIYQDKSPSSDLVWLAITAIIRQSSFSGTAQWQYVLPQKRKKIVLDSFEAYRRQIEMMSQDMRQMQLLVNGTSKATLYHSDARSFPEVKTNSVHIVITSPPYANNFDYADALRLEMSFWGEVNSWGELHEAVRKYLITSSSQHASKEKLILDQLLSSELLNPIKEEISEVCKRLAEERLQHGGRKHYHTMIAAYFIDMAKVWRELRRVCNTPCNLHFVIGDSAPYGIYVPVHRWLEKLALSSGFDTAEYQKIRDRNIKWKNRKHRVPLQEGILHIKG